MAVTTYTPYFPEYYVHKSSAPDRMPADESTDFTYNINQGNKKTLAQEAKDSSIQYSAAFKSKSPRFKTVSAFSLEDARFPTAKFSYRSALGPGDYEAPQTSTRSENKRLAVFKDTRPRFRSATKTDGDLNYSLDWDSKKWVQKGFYMSRNDKPLKGAAALANMGMLAPSSAPDVLYNAEVGPKKPLANAIAETRQSYHVFKDSRPRFPTLAAYKQNDPRFMNAGVASMPYSEPIGPGSYKPRR